MAETCGAKTRSGAPCRSKRMPNGRCRMHGGSTPTTNKNAVTHGFYCDALQPEERILWERVAIGSVDDEIKLMKVKLHRLVRLSGSSDVADLIDSALEVAHKHDTHPSIGAFDKTEIKVKAARYGDLIIQALDQIRKLELARKELNKTEDAPPVQPGPVSKIIVEVVGANTAHDHDRAPGAVLPA